MTNRITYHFKKLIGLKNDFFGIQKVVTFIKYYTIHYFYIFIINITYI